jgi:hypothetical protein
MREPAVSTYTIDTATSDCARQPRDLTVEQPHAIMQQHQHVTASCEQRKAARALLVATGRLVLAET